jgi:hypothetical protein
MRCTRISAILLLFACSADRPGGHGQDGGTADAPGNGVPALTCTGKSGARLRQVYAKGATCATDPKTHYDLGSEVLPANFVSGAEHTE